MRAASTSTQVSFHDAHQSGAISEDKSCVRYSRAAREEIRTLGGCETIIPRKDELFPLSLNSSCFLHRAESRVFDQTDALWNARPISCFIEHS